MYPTNVPASSPTLGLFSALSSGNGFTLALRTDGTVACWHSTYSVWGRSDLDYGVCNIPLGLTDVVMIAAGWLHGIAVVSNGSVVVWGSYVFTNPDGYNTQVLGLASSVVVTTPSSNIVAIAGGAGHSIMLLESGKVVAWGLDNTYTQQNIPASIQVGGWARATAISTSLHNNIALLHDDTVAVWGADSHGQLSVPTDLSNVEYVAAGLGQYVAGNPNGGLLKSSRTTNACTWGSVTNTTTLPSAGTNITAVSVGRTAAYLLHSMDYVEQWSLTTYSLVTLQMMRGVHAISAGPGHMAALSQCGIYPSSPPPLLPLSPPQFPSAPVIRSK